MGLFSQLFNKDKKEQGEVQTTKPKYYYWKAKIYPLNGELADWQYQKMTNIIMSRDLHCETCQADIKGSIGIDFSYTQNGEIISRQCVVINSTATERNSALSAVQEATYQGGYASVVFSNGTGYNISPAGIQNDPYKSTIYKNEERSMYMSFKINSSNLSILKDTFSILLKPESIQNILREYDEKNHTNTAQQIQWLPGIIEQTRYGCEFVINKDDFRGIDHNTLKAAMNYISTKVARTLWHNREWKEEMKQKMIPKPVKSFCFMPAQSPDYIRGKAEGYSAGRPDLVMQENENGIFFYSKFDIQEYNDFIHNIKTTANTRPCLAPEDVFVADKDSQTIMFDRDGSVTKRKPERETLKVQLNNIHKNMPVREQSRVPQPDRSIGIAGYVK